MRPPRVEPRGRRRRARTRRATSRRHYRSGPRPIPRVTKLVMGLFDKAKAFVGGKGMANVTITVIERQPAESAVFPVTDSVLKGTMVIEALKDCTLLATKYEIWLNIKGDVGESTGSPNLVVMAQEPDPNTSYSDDCLKLPCGMKAGQVIEQ